MKRLFIALILATTPLVAQPAKPAPPKPVAIVNGEVITAEKLDQMYDALTPDIRAQYATNGGKGALLDNYIRKRLILQEAAKTGFDKRASVKADVEAAKENVVFDRYVRDVVAAAVLNNVAMKNYYEFHQSQFAEPEMVKLRTITIGSTNSGMKPHTPVQAAQIAQKALADVLLTIPRTDNPMATMPQRAATFGKLARAYSEDRAAPMGGDLGWVSQKQLDPALQKAAFEIPVGLPSGIIETKSSYNIIFIEGKRAAGTLSFDEVKPRIRDLMLQEHGEDIMEAVNRVTNELGDKSRIAVYPENIR